MAPRTWLITGASSGFGLALALHALKSGDKVVGTSRSIDKARAAAPQFEEAGGVWEALDPGVKEAEQLTKKIVATHDIDFIVNNAGYALVGTTEDASDDEVEAQMQVNFMGPLRVIRGALPHLRAKGAGVIINFSSGAGLIGAAGRSTYTASKFALEGSTECLYREVAPFGIRVLLVEPGAFKTQFASTCTVPAAAKAAGGYMTAPYKGGPAEAFLTGLDSYATDPRSMRGDVDKAAQIILEAVHGGKVGAQGQQFRMVLGPDCWMAIEKKLQWLQEDAKWTEKMAKSTDRDDYEG